MSTATATEKKEWKPVILPGTTYVEVCPVCNAIVDWDDEWQGEDEDGRGWYVDHYRCPQGCGHSTDRHFE